MNARTSPLQRPSGRGGHAPLARRCLSMLAVRVVCATVAVGAIHVLPGLAGPDDHLVVQLSLVYVSAMAALELLRRAAGARWLGLLRALIVVDAIYLAVVVNSTGGTSSPLAFLVYLQIVAVTLVVSYRWGLEAAVAHCGLVFLGSSALGARYLDGLLEAAPSGAALRATSYLIVAVAAAALASVDERALRRSRSNVQAQLDLAAELHGAVDLQPTTAVLAHHLVDRIGFHRAVVLATGPTGESVGTVTGPVPLFVDRADVRVAELAAGRPATALVADLDDDLIGRLLPEAENTVLMNLEAGGQVVGVLAAEWGPQRRARIPADVLDAVTQAAATSALAFRAASLLAASLRHAGRDDLTGLANRRAFREALDREVSRTDRSHGELSLALFDLDNFKQVNDRSGHAAGDEILRLTAAALDGEARQSDLCARLGGDEFAVLLPDCGTADALEVAKRIVAAVGQDVDGSGVTVSAGVASFPAHGTAAELLVAADWALYRSKRDGRARVSTAAAAPAVIDLTPAPAPALDVLVAPTPHR